MEGLPPTVLPTGRGRELSIKKSEEASKRQSDGAVMSQWQEGRDIHTDEQKGDNEHSCQKRVKS